MTLYKWSQTAAADATADSTINWAEGQSPSSVNDSARAMMAATAKYRDDISGAIVTGGSSTAYTVSSYQVFGTLAGMNGQMIAFTPHVTNGATVTLNVDGLGAKPLRAQQGIELPAGSLILGTPYVATFNNSDAVWYLHNGAGIANAYSIPLGAGLDYWGATTPNSIFAFPAGQAISRTTYATLFALFGTTYGSGDGTSTFNLPDKSGRVSAMKEATQIRLTSQFFGADSRALGQAGGSDSHTLTVAQLAVHGHGVTDPGHNHSSGFLSAAGSSAGGGANASAITSSFVTTNSNVTGISIQNAGNGNAHNNVQPTIICNYILRII